MESTEEIQVSSPQPAVDPALLPLDGQRVVSFKDGTHSYALIFSRITGEDWRRCFAAIRIESERSGKEQVWRVDQAAGALELVHSKLESAQGYRMKDGSDFLARPDWKLLIPPGHKHKAAALLMDAKLSEQEDDAGLFDPAGLLSVALDARWGSSHPGKMNLYQGLLHTLKPPTVEHEQRFRRAMSESRVIGGSRTGRTIHSSNQPILAQLYDELIISVSGYGVSGRALEGTEQIRREMDGWHKISAMFRLFAGPDEQEMEEAA